jgi:hypothetical protein
LFLALTVSGGFAWGATVDASLFAIKVVSSRPDVFSGGDVLIGITAPSGTVAADVRGT